MLRLEDGEDDFDFDEEDDFESASGKSEDESSYMQQSSLSSASSG